MLVAAPESSCGAVMDRVRVGGTGFVIGVVASLAGRTNASVATWASVLRAVAGEGGRATFSSSFLLGNREGWAAFACGTYSVAEVSSREVAKSEAMPVAFSAAETIH